MRAAGVVHVEVMGSVDGMWLWWKVSWTWDLWVRDWLLVEVGSCFLVRGQVLGFESVEFLPFGNRILCEWELRYGL